MRLDFIDYPTGWKLQDDIGTGSPPHDPNCSAHTQAIIEHWISLGGDPERYR